MKRSAALLSGTTLALFVFLLFALCPSPSRAAVLGYSFGMNPEGGMGIKNTSINGFSATVTIVGVTVEFMAGSDAFFDTYPAAPGGDYGITNVAGVSAVLPDFQATDGQQTMTVPYSEVFAPGMYSILDFDLDAYAAPDSAVPDLSFPSTYVTVSFSTGHDLRTPLFSVGTTIGGYSYSYGGLAMCSVTPIPPAALLLGVGLAGLAGLRRRLRQ